MLRRCKQLDGFELTRRLRNLTGERWLPVIATSSLQGDEHVRPRHAGAACSFMGDIGSCAWVSTADRSSGYQSAAFALLCERWAPCCKR